ncbi:nicotinate-nucleotide adenylyltransferase [alpha proteobacterium U9-1i]|nr:nicotinate-nucleotide adenylyltransferase [alpha proteobacterium U9-1i]
MRRGLPLAYPGMKIGLFGGTFDPAHEGHAHVAETALKRLRLDRIWWLVTPQNPLKPQSSPLATRMKSAGAMAHGSKHVVTDLESRLGRHYTFETLRALKAIYPGVRFTFVMGADNLANFRQWKNWREVAYAAPIAIVARPGVPARDKARMPRTWTWLSARHHTQSSTAIRARKRQAVANRKPG